MKIRADVPNHRVTVDGIARTVVGLLPEYDGIESVEFDLGTCTGVITYESKARRSERITSIATLQSAIARWRDAKPSRASVWLDIKAKREMVKAGGVKAGANWFFTDAEAIIRYSVLYAGIAVNSLPNAYVLAPEWTTMRGNQVPMTVGLLKAIVGIGMRNEMANHANAERHKALMWLTTNPGSYDFYSGWTREFTP